MEIMITLASIGCMYVLWIFFLAYASLHAAWALLPVTTRILGVPVVVIGFVVDVAFNLTLGTVIFLELPHEATLSQRVSRLKRGVFWRASLATWICEALLDPFEARGHCR